MSQQSEAITVVRRNTEQVQSKGDFALFDRLFPDDYVDHTPQPGFPATKDGTRALYRALRTAFPDFRAEIHFQFSDGDRVATYKTYHGTHDGPFMGRPPSGKQVRFDSVDVMRIRGGQIVAHWGVGDLLGLLQQLGVVQTLSLDTPPARERPSSGCWRASAADRDAERDRTLQERMAQDETAIRAASAAWSRAAQSKDLEKSLTFFADTAILLSPKSPAVEGKENIRKVWQQMLALPGPGLNFSAARVEVARSGDLAWEQGTYQFTTQDENAKTTSERGTYVTVWKKQSDGAWRVVGDIRNTNE